MATTRPHIPSSRFSFLIEGLQLPLRNTGLFGPTLALAIAENVLHVSLAMLLPLHEARNGILVGAVKLLASVTVRPVIGAITTIAAATAYGYGIVDENEAEREAVTFHQVLHRLFLFDGSGRLTVGPVVATAVHGQIVAVAFQLGVAALLFPVELLVRYTRALLLLDLLVPVLLVAGLAQLYLGVVLSMAVVVSASEPAGCHRAAALRRAWVITAKNAGQAVILSLIANVVITAGISPRRTTTVLMEEPLDSAGQLLVSSASVTRVFSVCAVTAFYNECRHTVQEHDEELLLMQTGKELLNSLTIGCRNKLQEILQGRFSMRHMLATLVARLQCLCIWMLAFVSTHPWVACIAVVCATSRLITDWPPSIFYRNGLVSYRNSLRRKYHIYPKGCSDRW